MKKNILFKNVKKILKVMCIVIILALALACSYNENLGESLKSIMSNNVYAIKTDQSSTSTEKMTDQSSTYQASDMVDLLARLINGEARGEPYKGQVAVGAVVMNRVKSSEFPDTIAGVIYQKNQFSCVTDGQFDKAIDPASTVYKAAKEAINGADPTSGCIFFYNPKTSKSSWMYTRKTVITIGNHVFAK